MLDVNRIIANNIQRELEKRNLKPVDLAKEIGICIQQLFPGDW